MMKTGHAFLELEIWKMLSTLFFFFFFASLLLFLPKPGNLVLTPAASGVLLARQPRTGSRILQAEGSSASSTTTDRVVFTRF